VLEALENYNKFLRDYREHLRKTKEAAEIIGEKLGENLRKIFEETMENNLLENYWNAKGRKIKFCKKGNNTFYYWIEPIQRVSITDWTSIEGYARGWGFSTENSEILLKRAIESTSNEGDIVMDFFLGSGTTTAVAHKLKRKWIGIEMGEHFYSVVLPRMKKVLAYDKSGISKEVKEYQGGGFFKYQILEQYEDTLDNIELKENRQTQLNFGDDYLLKYFLDFETKDSPYLLNIEELKNPFAYKLKVNLSEVGEPQEVVVDIPETFNYLLGIKLKKIKKRKNNGKDYLFILGEKEGQTYAIVWRELSNNEEEAKKDKEFIREELKDWKPQIVYTNCPNNTILTPDFGHFQAEIRYIEPEFKKLMEV